MRPTLSPKWDLSLGTSGARVAHRTYINKKHCCTTPCVLREHRSHRSYGTAKWSARWNNIHNRTKHTEDIVVHILCEVRDRAIKLRLTPLFNASNGQTSGAFLDHQEAQTCTISVTRRRPQRHLYQSTAICLWSLLSFHSLFCCVLLTHSCILSLDGDTSGARSWFLSLMKMLIINIFTVYYSFCLLYLIGVMRWLSARGFCLLMEAAEE